MSALTIAVVLPELLNFSGDVANARVLAARARWGGLADRVHVHSHAECTDGPPHVVCLGSGADHTLPEAARRLRGEADLLRGWHEDGTQFIAVGSGWELLLDATEVNGTPLPGIGLVPGRTVVGEHRAGDLVVDTSWGRLVGFENHRRRVVGIDPDAVLGTVVAGVGSGNGFEGYRSDRVVGTYLHGPVFAKNPVLADDVLRRLAARLGASYRPDNTAAADVDTIAAAARARILADLDLTA